MATGGSAKLVIRIVVFGVLAIVLVFALLDYRAKSAASATSVAWVDAVGKNEEVMLRLDLAQHIVGDPKVESKVVPEGTEETYTWPGIFRDYQVIVTLSKSVQPEDAIVMSVVGPKTK